MMEWVTAYIDAVSIWEAKIVDIYYSSSSLTVYYTVDRVPRKPLDAFRKNDRYPYTVTYALDEVGKYLARFGEWCMHIADPDTGHQLVYACFLPKSWDGRRVTRVEEEFGGGVKK